MSSYKLPDLSKFPDCCALSERGKCTRLAIYTCEGEECRFKRTFEEDNNSLQYVYRRLSSLDITIQLRIAEKYYGGSMPWSDAKTVKAYRAYERLTALDKENIEQV